MRVQSLGKFQLVGRIGAIDVIPGNKGIRISVAVNETTQDEKNDKIRTHWISVTVWGEKRIEALLRVLKPGFVVAADGDLASSEYTTKGGDRLTILGLVVGPNGSITTIHKFSEQDTRRSEEVNERDTRALPRR